MWYRNWILSDTKLSRRNLGTPHWSNPKKERCIAYARDGGSGMHPLVGVVMRSPLRLGEDFARACGSEHAVCRDCDGGAHALSCCQVVLSCPAKVATVMTHCLGQRFHWYCNSATAISRAAPHGIFCGAHAICSIDSEVLCHCFPTSGAANQMAEAVSCATNRRHNRGSPSRVHVDCPTRNRSSQEWPRSPTKRPRNAQWMSSTVKDQHTFGLVLHADVAHKRFLPRC